MSEPVLSSREPTGEPVWGRPPSMTDAVLPVVVLIALLALTIALFGIDATNGPLQVALLLSAAFASLMAFKNGALVFSQAGALPAPALDQLIAAVRAHQPKAG